MKSLLYLFKQIYIYGKGHRWMLFYCILAYTIAATASQVIPYVFGEIINQFQTNLSLDLLLKGFLVILGLRLIVLIFFDPTRLIELRYSVIASTQFMEKAYSILTSLPMAWHTNHHSGDTINRIQSATRDLKDFGRDIYAYIYIIIQLIVSVVMLYIIDHYIAYVVVLGGVVSLLIIKNFDVFLIKLYKKRHENNSKVLAIFFDYISNIKTILTLRLETRTKKNLMNKYWENYPVDNKAAILEQVKWALFTWVFLLIELYLLYYFASESIKTSGTVMIGTLFAIKMYINTIVKVFNEIAWRFQDATVESVTIKGADNIMKHKVIVKKSSLKKQFEEVLIKELYFKYEEETGVGKVEISKIPFQIKKGERIALVGESGGGKSTLLALLRGLFEPQKVQAFEENKLIKFNSITANSMLVPQDPEIFENTILYNITMDTPYTKKQISEALEMSRFDIVLKKLPYGIKTDIREKGVNLSGGEKQRLALARGILAGLNSDVFMLDEATSSVDAHNEHLIMKGIFSKFKDKVIIASVHRLHTLKSFDKVYMFESGKIIEVGTFEELKNKNGKFATLWKKYDANLKKKKNN